MGVSVSNTWGAFGDTGKEPRKYCASQISAFTKEGKEFNLGYRKSIVAMNIAYALGDKIFSGGGDPNIWGADITLGLMENKAIAGFYPFPENTFEYLKILNSDELIEKGGESGFAFLSLNTESKCYKEIYLNKTIKELPYQELFQNETFDPTKIWVLHYWGKSKKAFSSPLGIPIKEHLL